VTSQRLFIATDFDKCVSATVKKKQLNCCNSKIICTFVDEWVGLFTVEYMWWVWSKKYADLGRGGIWSSPNFC